MLIFLYISMMQLGGLEAFGATEKKNESDSILTLERRLKQLPSQSAVFNIKKATEAYTAKQWKKAIQLGSKIARDVQFGDYGYWMSAQAYHAQAEHQLKRLDFKAALLSVSHAKPLILQVLAKYPDSPWRKELPKELARNELLAAQIYWANSVMKKNKELAKQNFENALQRIQTDQLWKEIPWDWIKNYVELCQTQFNPSCQSWLSTMMTHYAHQMSPLKDLGTQPFVGIHLVNSIQPAARSMIFYKAPDLDQVAFLAALKLYLERKYEEAIKSFKAFLEDFPRSYYQNRARFVLAQIYSLKNEADQAKAIYEDLKKEAPLTYYGFLASSRTEKKIESLVQVQPPRAADSDPALHAQDYIHLRRAQHFLNADIRNFAALELKKIRSIEYYSDPFLTYLAMLNQKAGDYRGSFILIGELLQRSHSKALSEYLIQMTFPLAFTELIQRYATQLELDPLLIMSLIKQESGFDSEACSVSGAMGLMQLMPLTALEVDPTVKLEEVYLPEVNIRLGSQYLKNLLNRFHGNVVLALAGYNAGPNVVDRWVKEFGKKTNPIDFVESITYKQTREYVGSIIRNYYWYSLRLKKPAPQEMDFFWKPIP